MQLLEKLDALPAGLADLAILAVVILISVAVRYLLYYGVTQWLKLRRILPEKTSVGDHFGIVGFFLVSAIFLNISFAAFKFAPHLVDYVAQLFRIYLVLAATWFCIRAAHFIQVLAYERFDITGADNMRQRKMRTQIQFIVKIIVLFVGVAGFAAVLMTFAGARRFGASILASAGVASVVIGFAAQRSLGNFIAGFQIAFTQPIRLDDVLIVETEWGRVEEITLTYVVVKLWDLRRLILPITYFVEKPFQNWTRNSSNILGYSYLYVDYSLPVEEVRKELKKICHDDPLWDGTVCILQVTDTTEKTIQLRALVSARNASDAFDLRCNIREKLVNFIQANYPTAFPQNRAIVADQNSVLSDPQKFLPAPDDRGGHEN